MTRAAAHRGAPIPTPGVGAYQKLLRISGVLMVVWTISNYSNESTAVNTYVGALLLGAGRME
jgi:hypothetical protein